MSRRVGRSVRVGVGAVALGMSLAGPALGVAAADTSEPDSASVLADSSPAGAGRATGSGSSAAPASTRVGRLAAGRANLTGANLTGVFWRNTPCPDGKKTDTGCSALPGVSAVVVDPVVVQLNSDGLESRVW